MTFRADLHIHSRFARACSKDITLQKLEMYARMKGIDLLGTGDFQHPLWNKEIKTELTEDGSGILRTSTAYPFMLQTEISLMYSQEGRGRKIHHLVFAPSLEVSDQIIEFLATKGRMDYDGRPIFGMTTPYFIESLKSISNDIEIIPAHAWTPYFGIFGSMSGFDSIKECAGDQAKHIHAIETGMSSDPAMNRQVSSLDKTTLVSFSDIHSFWPWRMGREMTVFDTALNYKEIIHSMRNNSLHSTIETDPNYGRYHFDGHAKCKVSLSPTQTKSLNGICPACHTPVTRGVQFRVEQLADRDQSYIHPTQQPFIKLLPLHEVLSAVLECGVATKKTWDIYGKLIAVFGNEMKILLDVQEQELTKVVDKNVVEGILLNRRGAIHIIPGYDGEYGQPVIGGKGLPHNKMPCFIE